VRRAALDWRVIAFVALIAILIYQVVVPFVMIIFTSLKTARPDEPDFLSSAFSLANYARAFGTATFWSATWNTLAFALASTIVSFGLGAFVAWVLERTNTPLARLIGILLIGRIIIPGILITISWILIASPRIGILNYFARTQFGLINPFNVYSFWGMVWVQSMEMVPLTYLLLSAAFKAMDPRLEEASTMTGAGTLRTMLRISFPLALPAVAAALLLLFVTAIESFEVPLLMGQRADIRVFTTEIFYNTSRTPVDWGLSSTYAVALLILSTILLLVYFRLVRHGERYQTITGKDFRPHKIDLGPWRYVTCAAALLLVFLTTGAPFLIILYASFLPLYQPPTAAAFQAMSLANYKVLFQDSYAVWPLINSTILALCTASVVVVFVAAISYFVHKTRFAGRRLLDFLAFAPIGIPSVVLGAAFLWFYLIVPLPVIGTLLIIGLAYLTKFMPFALRFVSSSMTQIHSELEEAAEVAGVTWSRNFIRIFLPLLRPGLLAAWFWVMVHAYRELTIAMMLVRSQNQTAAFIIYDYWERGSFLQLSAFGVVIFVLLLVLITIANSIGARIGVSESY
jgi:iron(III) transport system permease protein